MVGNHPPMPAIGISAHARTFVHDFLAVVCRLFIFRNSFIFRKLHFLQQIALYSAPIHLRDDRDVVMAAVSSDGLALKYASRRLRDDQAIVLAAIAQTEDAIEYASPRLVDKDKDVVLAAITENDVAFSTTWLSSI
jgi:hypothetical protein